MRAPYLVNPAVDALVMGGAALADLSASSAWVSVPLFAATAAVFRLMSRFER